VARPDDRPRVAVIGGVPATLGGGGLERQVERTAAALRAVGVDARQIGDVTPDWAFDVLHVFGHTADVGHYLHHWRRQPARLVVSPVVVVPPAREWRLRLATRLPIPAFEPRVLRALAERADRLIALTRWEADLLRQIGGKRAAAISIVGNGVEPAGELPDRAELARHIGAELPDRYAIVVGAVSDRKRQAEVARALAGSEPLIAVGGWEGPSGDRERFDRLVTATGGRWLGEIGERRIVDGLIAEATALVHLSEAEGESLAVLEALALGTPCVLSDLPQQRELALRWPRAVTIVADSAAVAGALADLPATVAPLDPPVPSWEDVARSLAAVYASLDGPPRVWGDRA
jgi:glycosyltransferase involved in cell wall biosynthesis